MDWKHEIGHLREAAQPVVAPPPGPPRVGAREVARLLGGVASTLARRHGVEAMQAAFAELALDRRALESKLSDLPRDASGKVDAKIELIAIICRGILSVSSTDSVRAALAFWASETDPGVWQSVVLAA